MVKMLIMKSDYNIMLDLIDKYLNDIFVDEKGNLEGVPSSKDLLSDVLSELDIERE